MNQFVKKIIFSTILLLCLDGIYIYINQQFFADTIVNVQRVIMQIKPVGALFAYLFIIFMVNYFILSKNRSALEAFVLGFTTYGIYEFTNYAMIKKWPISMVIMDTIWGGILFGLTTHITYMLLNL